MKKLKKIFKYVLWTTLFVLVCLLINAVIVYQRYMDEDESFNNIADSPIYHPKGFTQKSIDSLNHLYGHNKTLPKGFELQTLLALSHYPELKDVKVTFRLEPTFIPLASRPYWLSLFQSKKHWDYHVIISSKSSEAMEPILLKNLPFNAQVAIIGHELAHTLYYQDKNLLDIIGIATCYPHNGFRAFFETQTDRRTVYHGLGPHLIEYATYVRKDKESDYLDQYYLNPKALRKVLKEKNGQSASTL